MPATRLAPALRDMQTLSFWTSDVTVIRDSSTIDIRSASERSHSKSAARPLPFLRVDPEQLCKHLASSILQCSQYRTHLCPSVCPRSSPDSAPRAETARACPGRLRRYASCCSKAQKKDAWMASAPHPTPPRSLFRHAMPPALHLWPPSPTSTRIATRLLCAVPSSAGICSHGAANVITFANRYC